MTRESATIDAAAELRRLAPVAPKERILALDVLRGIALFGVRAAWRSLTYGRAQPMRLAHAAAPVAAPSTKLRVLLIGTLAPTVLAACAETPEAVLSADLSPAAVTLTQTCTSLRGTAVDVQDDLKVLNARLQGDVSGTLQIIEHTQRQAGVVERSSATYTVEVEPGAVLFGDGIAGRVPPSGGTHGTTYRYGAEGNVEGGTGVYSEMTGRWEIDGWISDGTTATRLDYRMVLCAR